MSTMVQGAAFGAGSEVGHQAVKSMMGGGSSQHSEPAAEQQMEQQPAYQTGAAAQQQPMENPCMRFNQNLLSCLQQNRGEVSICQSYMDMLNQCETDTRMSSNYQ